MTAIGPVEAAIRAHLREGQQLGTPSRGAPFVVSRIDRAAVTLLLGEKRTATPLPWSCWEGIPKFLDGKGWVDIGMRYSVDADPTTLDGYLKAYMKRATAGWVAVVLETARVIEIDRGLPARVRLLGTASS